MEDCVIDGPTVEGGNSVTKITCGKVQCLAGSHWVGSGGPAERFYGEYLNDLAKCLEIREMKHTVQVATGFQVKKFELTESDK
jgi:hypothetical protein